MLAMGPRDLNSAPYSPVHCSSHSMTSFQSSELTELPVVENGQLFAQRAHSARTAHGTPPKEEDFISAPNALIIVDCMTEIARANFDGLDPSRHAQARDVRRLHWAVCAREYYFRNKKSLTAHLTLAAAGAGHVLALQNECSPFDT